MGEEEFVAAAMGMRSKLYHVAMSILWNEQDAADAVQEAMLKGWKHRAGLRGRTAGSGSECKRKYQHVRQKSNSGPYGDREVTERKSK